MKRRIRDALALRNSFVSETLKSILFCHFPDVTWTCSFHSSISSKHDLTLSATEQKPKRSPLHPSSLFPVSLTAAARSRWLSASQHMSTGPQITPTSRPLPAEASGDQNIIQLQCEPVDSALLSLKSLQEFPVVQSCTKAGGTASNGRHTNTAVRLTDFFVRSLCKKENWWLL